MRPCRRLDSVSHRAGPMMSTSLLHSTTTSSAAFSIVFYHYASTIVARVRPTCGLTRNAATQSVLHAGWGRAYAAACRRSARGSTTPSDSDPSVSVASVKAAWYEQRRKYRQLSRQKFTDFWHDKIDADPLPTSTLKQAINLLAPFIVEIFNRSLARGLCWLRAKDRVRFKTAVLMYKATRGTAPSYLSQLFRVADRLGRCSARTNRLLVPSVKLSTVGRRAFPIAGPAIWNSLPDNVISAPSLSSFRQRLKHFCSRPRSPTLSLIPGKLSPLQWILK